MRFSFYTLMIVLLSGTTHTTAQPSHRHHEDPNNNVSPAHASHDALHFSHPLVAESPTPDHKLRLDYRFDNEENGGQTSTLRLEAEYAFNRHVSVEIDAPYTWTDPTGSPNENNLGNVEISLKLASYAFEQHGVVVGGGIEFGLPTGDDDRGIGDDHVLEIEPFIDVGFKRDRVQVIAFLTFGIPTNEPGADKDEEDLELGFNLAFQYDFTPSIAGLFEIDASSVVSGDDNKTVVNLIPGIKIQPTQDPSVQIGIGVSFPVSNDQEFDSRVIVSFFKHF